MSFEPNLKSHLSAGWCLRLTPRPPQAECALTQSAQKNRALWVFLCALGFSVRFGLKHTLHCVIRVKSWKLEALIWAGSGVIFYKKFLCETSHLISCGRLSILIWTAGAEGRFEGLIITLGFIGTLTAPPLNIAIIWRCNLSRSFSSLRRHSSFSFSSLLILSYLSNSICLSCRRHSSSLSFSSFRRSSISCLDNSRLSSLSLKTRFGHKISSAFGKSNSPPDQLVESIGSLVPWVAAARRSRHHQVRGIESLQSLE